MVIIVREYVLLSHKVIHAFCYSTKENVANENNLSRQLKFISLIERVHCECTAQM